MLQIKFTSVLFLCLIIDHILTAPSPTKPYIPNDPGRRLAMLNYGRTLNRDLSHNLVKNIYNFNSQVRQFANNIPHNSSLRELVVPLHFSSNIGNLVAPYVVRHMVTRPLEQATISVANWLDYLGSKSELVSSFITNTLGFGSKKPMVRRSVKLHDQ